MRMPVAAALVAAFLCPLSALAQPCSGMAEIEIVVANTPYAEIAHDLRGADATAFVAEFNSIPPVSAIMADQVAIVVRHAAMRGAILFLLDGCIVATGSLPMLALERVTNDVLGVPHTVFKER